MQILKIGGYESFDPSERRIWSASTLQEVTECPKRYVLRRGNFPSIWEKSGFPTKSSSAQIKGIVVHALVAKVVDFVESSPETPLQAAMGYLRENGGYVELLKATIEVELDKLKGNPRSEMFMDIFRKELVSEIASLRNQTQFFVNKSLTHFKSIVADAVVSSNLTRSTRKKIGTVNSEFHIEDASYPIEGFIDLLVVGDQRDRILDFKTSKDIRPEYWEQLKLYAWLWSRCAENQLPKETELSVVTGIGTIEIISLTHEDLLSLEREISAKITESDRLISLKEPTAIPTTENCKFCAVKVVCDDYWESNVVSNAGKTDSWVDLRIRITSDLGGGNWKVTFLDTGEMGILLLGGRDDGSISVDAELRLLGVFKKVTEDDGICIRLSQASEIFLYSPPRK